MDYQNQDDLSRKHGNQSRPCKPILPKSRWPAGLALALASLLAVMPALAQAPQPRTLGRLFTTPELRDTLERRRQLNIKEAEVVEDMGVTSVNGRVVRSSGKTTTWVNGVPEDDADRSRQADRVTIDGGDARGRIPLKVGQTLDRAQSTVIDGLNGGQVRVVRPDAAAGRQRR